MLSGRALYLRQKGHGFKPPASQRCLLEQDTQEDLSQHNRKFFDWDVKNQINQKQTNKLSKNEMGVVNFNGFHMRC